MSPLTATPRSRTKRPTATSVDPDGYPYDELKPLVRTCLQTGVSVLLRGHPGVGKSTMADELAAELDLPLCDIRLAQREPAEVAGVYFPNEDRTQMNLLAPAWVKDACARPTLVFLDEINAAVTRLHQAAAYQIVLERRVGPFHFHPQTVVMAAGNLEEDRAIVTPLSSALANRFVHFILRVDVPAWIAWAERNDIAPQVLAYMRAHRLSGTPLLYDNNGDDAFPTPRSWAMASRLLQVADKRNAKRLVSACIGAGPAQRLFAFVRLYNRIDPAKVVGRGQAVDFTRGQSTEPSFAYAAITAVGRWTREHEDSWQGSWVANLVKFMRSPGLDPEYVFILLRDLNATPGLLDKLKGDVGFQAIAAEIVKMHAEALS